MTETSDPADDEPIEVEFEPARQRKGRWRIFSWCALTIALIAGLAAIGWIGQQKYRQFIHTPESVPTRSSTVNTAQPDREHAQITKRLEQLETTLASMTTMTKRISRLETTSARMRSALTTRGEALADVNERLIRLTDRLGKLETATGSSTATKPGPTPETIRIPQPPPTSSDRALRVGLAALEAALKTNAPFDETYGIVTELAPDDEHIGTLEPIARIGAPLWSELNTHLQDYRQSHTVQQRARERQERSIWQKILDSLVTFDADTDNTDKHLDEAEQALESGDIDALESALASHKEHPVVADLIDGARRRLIADHAAASIRARLRVPGDIDSISAQTPTGRQ